MSTSPRRPKPTPETQPLPGVDDFARSVHASYLRRWLRHDPAALENVAGEEKARRKRRRRSPAA